MNDMDPVPEQVFLSFTDLYKQLQKGMKETNQFTLVKVCIFLVSFLVVVILSLLVLISLILFYIWRKVLTIILTYKYGANFGGLLEPLDAAFAVQEVSPNIINTLITLESELSLPEFILYTKKCVYEKCFKNPKLFPKFLHVRERFLGTYFLIKCGHYEEVVRVFNCKTETSVITEDELLKIVQKIHTEKLPKNSNSFLEVVVIDKPIEKLSGRSFKKPIYVILLRMHHSLGDGFALANFFFYHFCAENSTVEFCFGKVLKNKKDCRPMNIVSGLKTVLTTFAQIVAEAPEYLGRMLNNMSNKNFCNRKNLSGDKIVVYATEPDRRLVKLTKDIKNYYPGTSFSDILFTAISASFSEFFEQDIKNSPGFFPAYIPVPFNMSKLHEIVLTNNLTNLLYHVPLISHQSLSLEARLNCIKVEKERIINSIETVITYWCQKFLCLFPSQILQIFGNAIISGMSVISVMPGTEHDYFNSDQFHVIDVHHVLPRVMKLGFNLCISSHDGRFQMALVVDKSLITDQNKAKLLLDGIFKYIEIMHSNIKK